MREYKVVNRPVIRKDANRGRRVSGRTLAILRTVEAKAVRVPQAEAKAALRAAYVYGRKRGLKRAFHMTRIGQWGYCWSDPA